MKKAVFQRPDGLLLAILGVFILTAGTVATVLILIAGRNLDLGTIGLIVLGFAGSWALGSAFLNAWRTPLLTVTPNALTIPTFFGKRHIPITATHPIGEFLGVSKGSGNRSRTIEARKLIHFYTLDASGKLTQLVALHRNAPDIPKIRRAFHDVAGLSVETLGRDPTARTSRPDVSHWNSP